MGSTYHIGIDLGGTNIKFAVIDRTGHIVQRLVVPTHAHEGHDAVIDRMMTHAKELMAQVPGDGTVASIGVAVPGVIDMDAGVTKFLTNFPGHWPDVPVGPRISEATGLPAYLINDVRAFTLAELTLGAAKGVTTGLCFAIGTGIGGGVIAHGKVNFGLGGAGGELGHIIVDPSGPRCNCGNRGCAEAFASGPAIVGEALRRILQGATTRLRDAIDDDLNRMTPSIIEQEAETGDAVAIEILETAGFYLGIAVASAIAALAPEVVIIGGGNVKPGGVFWRAIEETARSHSHVTEIDRIGFKPPELGYDAGMVGAALWGMQSAGYSVATV
jgi:glucokinase